jgi:hypothetical protein
MKLEMEMIMGKNVWLARGEEKRPVGAYAQWKNAPHYTSYEVAASYEHWQATGKVCLITLSPIVTIDFDKIIHDSVIFERVKRMVKGLDTWTEFSTSGTGLHVVGLYFGKNIGIQSHSLHDGTDAKDPHFEIYLQPHIVAMTFNKLDGSPSYLRDITDIIDATWKEETNLFRFRRKPRERLDRFSVTDVIRVKDGLNTCPWCGSTHDGGKGKNFDYSEEKDLWVCHHQTKSGGDSWTALAVAMGLITCKEAKKGCLDGFKFPLVVEEARKRKLITDSGY